MPSVDAASCFDYIVVGAGSAGCVVASRLSEDPDATVLLLEAGGDGLRDVVRDPQAWPTLKGTERDWQYETIPIAGTGHAHSLPRGLGLGGSHAINTMAFMRGHRSDFESWAAGGNRGWGWDQVLPYFMRMETRHGGDPSCRGSAGPLEVAPTARPHPITRAFLEAGGQAGHPLRHDFNCGETEGIGIHDVTIVDGSRQTTADAYLRPALSRENLMVETRALARRLRVENGRCTGVEYLRDGKPQRADAGAEVVLSAGAIGSPALLLLSGIGDPDELRALDIPVAAALPGVGRNLHDHVILLGVCVEASRPIPPGTGNFAEAVLYWRSDPGLPAPDLHIVIVHGPSYNPWQEPRSGDSYSFCVAHMRPASRGRLTLASSNPRVAPLIDMNYLGEPRDVDALVQGVEKALELRAQPAFAPWHGRDAMSGADDGRRETLVDLVREGVSTFSHACGSCRMGVDDGAVVDPELRVRGVDGLRVADASVMPTVTSTPTNAATIMIGEKAADLVRGRA